VRVLRASDRTELSAGLFTHDRQARELWHVALEPTLTALAAAIVETLPPAPDAERLGEAR
jgi:hypothetical protein